LYTRPKINFGLTASVHANGLKLFSSRLEMTLAMSQEIDFLVMQWVFRRVTITMLQNGIERSFSSICGLT
jgi:hypothetical protein